jgi:hypothetical protein
MKARITTRLCVLLALSVLGACTDRLPTEASAVAASSATRLVPAEGFAARGEVRTGYVAGAGGRPEAVTFEVQGGDAIVEGDIVLARASEVARTPGELALRPPRQPSMGAVVDGERARWVQGGTPEYGVVYYEIDPSLPNPGRVTAGIALIEEQQVGVYFYPRTGQADYLRFVPSAGCASYVGRIGGMQEVYLADGCSAGNAAHEVLHALGMWHEQSRCDRDGYVEVLWGNVEPGREFNFDQKCDGSSDIDAYAEGSIMHYHPLSFSANGQPTLRSRRGLDARMGQRAELGPTDVATLRALYAPNGLPACRPATPGGSCGTGPVAPATVLLVGRQSGKCAEVPGASHELGTQLVIRPCHGGDNQRFQVPAVGATGEVRLYGGAQCLDAWTALGNNGDKIAIHPCHGGANQQWTRLSTGELRGVGGRCVDVAGASTENNAPLILWDCHGGANQRFDARPRAGAAPAA